MKMHDETVLFEIFERLHKENEENRENPIPESDTIYKSILGDICSSKEECMDALDRLIQARYVFKIVLSEGNPEKDTPDVLGFISTDIKLIQTVTDIYKDKLQAAYEHEKYQRKDATTIIKEVIPQMQIYRSTPIGKLVNILVMLEQFQQIIMTNFWDYKDSRKRADLKDIAKNPSRIIGKKNAKVGEERSEQANSEMDGEELQEKVKDIGVSGDDEVDVFVGDKESTAALTDDFNIPEPSVNMMAAPEPGEASPSVSRNQPVPGDVPDIGGSGPRATESAEYQKLQEMDLSGKWGVAVSHYGVQFLLRIHFRKYEFETVIRLVINKRIAKMEDLKYIVDTLSGMLKNMDRDPPLYKHKSIMQKLRQMALSRINMIESAR